MTLISLLVVLIIVGVGLYLVQLIPMEKTVQKIITALVILAVVLWVLESFGLVGGPIPHVRMR